jgi:hypothetical protein
VRKRGAARVVLASMNSSLHELVRASHRHVDQLLPHVPVVAGLQCQDHATFVAAASDEQAFRSYWSERGLTAMDPLSPRRYPARHIAFAADPGNTVLCEDMIGLSVSDDPASPIIRTVELYGGSRVDERGDVAAGRLQHVAFAVERGHTMEAIRADLEALGVRFMTPILTFADASGSGAELQQMFVACRVPYGPFVEIIRRGEGANGEPFQGFDPDQIDALYTYYDAYSRTLCQ